MNASPTSPQTVLRVEGMSCNSCVRHVEGALRDVAGVRNVEVHLDQGKAIVEHNSPPPQVEAMLEAIREAGYEASVEA